MRSATVRGIVLGLAASMSVTGCAERAKTSPRAVATADELTAVSLQGRWWSWAATEGWETNPVADDDGRDCGRNQPEDVWFLAGTFGGHAERTCTIPAGTPIALPVVNRLGDADGCRAFLANAEGAVELDGANVEVERYVHTDVMVTAVAGNPLTTDGGTFRAGACGLWAQLPPLQPGEHSLRIAGGSEDLRVSAVYRLTVKAGPGR